MRRLRVVPNFDHSGEIHASARKWATARRRASRRGAARARASISPESPKLETTRSLIVRVIHDSCGVVPSAIFGPVTLFSSYSV